MAGCLTGSVDERVVYRVFLDKLHCWRCGHQWVNDAEMGIPPPVDLATCTVAEAFRYNRGWCKRCRRYQKPSIYLCGSEHRDKKLKYR